MPSLNEIHRQWEALAADDPYWAISTERKKGNRANLDEFWASGREAVTFLLARLDQLGLQVDRGGRAIDFGCGVGRVTQALAEIFPECVGVDSSSAMLDKARAFNRFPDRCRYLLNTRSDLALLDDDSFDLVFSTAVLQHMPTRYQLRYLAEMVRILRPTGALVVHLQAPRGGPPFKLLQEAMRIRARLSIRTRLRRLRGVITSREPRMEMYGIGERRVGRAIGRVGGRIVARRYGEEIDPCIQGSAARIAARLGWGLRWIEYDVVLRGTQSDRPQS